MTETSVKQKLSFSAAFSWLFLVLLVVLYLLNAFSLAALMLVVWVGPVVAIVQLLIALYLGVKMLKGRISASLPNLIVIGLAVTGGALLAVIIIYLYFYMPVGI